MHDEQVDCDLDLVRALIADQRPSLAAETITFLPTSGTDNAIYRIGSTHVARFPIIEWASHQVAHEWTWLPRIAPLLPVAVPEPVFVGRPGRGYPFTWGVHRWIEGRNPRPGEVRVDDLVALVRAIQAIDLPDVPRSGRGRPLRWGEERTREAIEALRGEVDADALIAIWERALAAPKWSGPWLPMHGDLSENNLLVDDDGRLVGLIDFSLFGLGDPACEHAVAFELFDAAGRAAYRAALAIDDDTWARAAGWAVTAVVGIPYYRETNPEIVERALRRLLGVLEDRSPT